MPIEPRKFGLTLSEIIPVKTRVRLIAVWLVVLVFVLFSDNLTTSMTPLSTTLIFILLLCTIVGAAFGVVKQADALAYKLGEPYGTLILTLSIVSIEVILISAVMLGPGEFPTIGKDSIFSVMMIIMNLVMGLCILLGGLKYREQEYNAQGSLTYLTMIILLGGISMLLPNFILGAGSGMFTSIQAVMISAFIVVLYGLFLALQMGPYRHLYVQPPKGMMEIPYQNRSFASPAGQTSSTASIIKTESREIILRAVILIAMMLPIVILSGDMAQVVDYGIQKANLPPLLGGVLIAIIVFTPESITAVKAALNNEFQRAVNLCHGAFVSTVGLSVPSVLIIGLLTDQVVLFGLSSTETLLFIITLLLSLMSFLGRRTTPVLGLMHLTLFMVFILLIFSP